MSLEQAFSDAMHKLNITKSEPLAVAVSGGADSMSLTILTNKWSEYPIKALTVDHKLRQESAEEAIQVGRQLKELNIEHHILNIKPDSIKSNIQATARDIRYKLMTDYCIVNNIKYLLVAHNKEDQAETVLIRLMRGSGVNGLCGMENKIHLNNITIIRPLLSINKYKLTQYLKENNVNWVEDPSNKDDKYLRSKIRKFIQSEQEVDLLVDRLAKTAENMQRSRLYIEDKISEEMQLVTSFRPEGYCVVNIKEFRKLHTESAYRILSALLKAIGGKYYKTRFEKLDNLYINIMQNNKVTPVTLAGCQIYTSGKKNESENLIIIREIADITDKQPIVADNESVIWDNRFYCTLDNQNGEFYISSIGKEGLKNILSQTKDILKNANLSKKIIYGLPALHNFHRIIAAPHINYYENDSLKANFKVELTLKF